jgi:lipopolysaccharide export system protein LptA
MRHSLSFLILTILFSISANAQQTQGEDRLVRLLSAKTAEIYQNEFRNIRKVTGPAQFLHNNTLIICDTAIWDLTYNIVDAIGNVKIVQDRTILSGDRVNYLADSSIARVRGNLVELIDKDSNRLRTLHLDYNTKDSIAYFFNGGSMMDKKGKVIESIRGYYHSKIERFKFIERVELNSDSLVLKSDSLAYWSKDKRVDFLGSVKVWQNNSFLSSNSGWYNREKEIYNFDDNAYMLNGQNELWAKRIYYERAEPKAELYDDVQILDTAQSMLLFSDFVRYRENPVFAELYKNPSLAYYSVENDLPDTLFFAADTIHYRMLPKFEMDSATVALSQKRYSLSRKDPIKEMYNRPTPLPKDSTAKKPVVAVKPPATDLLKTAAADSLLKITAKDSLKISVKDSLSNHLKDSLRIPVKDSLSNHLKDSLRIPVKDSLLLTPKDTTLIRVISANKNIRFYRSNIQGRCDSLMFNSIDSIIRLYKDPVLWNENNQFTADSIQLITSNEQLSKTELISGAFVATKEDSLHYNQIKATDIVAHFTEGDLTRFDAYGGVTVIFFFAEDSILTTMNQKECKTMTAIIKEKSVQRVRYFETVQSDLYPIIDVEPEKKRLKGFRLRYNERPASRFEVTTRSVIPSSREYVSTLELPGFFYTNQLFGKTPALPAFEIFTKKETEPVITAPPSQVESTLVDSAL